MSADSGTCGRMPRWPTHGARRRRCWSYGDLLRLGPGGWATGSAAPEKGSGSPVDTWRLDQHDDDHDEGEDDRLVGRGHAQEQHGGVEGLDDQDADHCARDAELATQERGAAEDDGENGVQLDQLASGVS